MWKGTMKTQHHLTKLNNFLKRVKFQQQKIQKETFDLHIIKLRDILEGLQKNVSKLCPALISHFPSLRTSASIETTW